MPEVRFEGIQQPDSDTYLFNFIKEFPWQPVDPFT